MGFRANNCQLAVLGSVSKQKMFLFELLPIVRRHTAPGYLFDETKMSVGRQRPTHYKANQTAQGNQVSKLAAD